MATFNGKQENLRFTCGSCGDETIDINPESKDDMIKLGAWLLTHSYNGGTYKCIKIKNKCELCGDNITWGTEIVNHTGKVVCKYCAKTISKIYIERN